MTRTPHKRQQWILVADPHHYHWDTLFVKGKEMWRGAGSKPDALRQIRQMRRGDRVLCYHAAPDRAVYALAEVTRDPYPDPYDPKGKNMAVDLRALEKLPRPVKLTELRASRALRKLKFSKNVRRLVTVVSDEEYQEILRMAGITPQPGIPLP